MAGHIHWHNHDYDGDELGINRQTREQKLKIYLVEFSKEKIFSKWDIVERFGNWLNFTLRWRSGSLHFSGGTPDIDTVDSWNILQDHSVPGYNPGDHHDDWKQGLTSNAVTRHLYARHKQQRSTVSKTSLTPKTSWKQPFEENRSPSQITWRSVYWRKRASDMSGGKMVSKSARASGTIFTSHLGPNASQIESMAMDIWDASPPMCSMLKLKSYWFEFIALALQRTLWTWAVFTAMWPRKTNGVPISFGCCRALLLMKVGI